MYFLQYSRDKEDENGQAFLGINSQSPIPSPISPPYYMAWNKAYNHIHFQNPYLLHVEPLLSKIQIHPIPQNESIHGT
jgi:hypothetical protein